MADAPAVEVVNNEADGRFEVRLGDEVAFTEYRLVASGILFPHTEVPPAFEGRGVASALVRAAMAFARERGQKVIPVCPFVAGYVAKHPEFHDLVHPDYRAALGI
jgi:predicted GNAT family acetyltransferase